MKMNKMDRIKSTIEDFCYMLGVKVYFKRKEIPELKATKNLNLQFKHLATIKEWLEADLKEESTNTLSKTNANTVNVVPELRIVEHIDRSPDKVYALIWDGSARNLMISYDEKGELFFTEKEKTPDGFKLKSWGTGVNVFHALGSLNTPD